MGFRTSLAALTLTALTASAHPAAAEAPATIAYAQRTQTWEVVLTSGEVVEVPEALAVAPKKEVSAGVRAPFLVSGDGRHIVYYRKKDGRLVERTVYGKERVVAKDLTVGGIEEEWPIVSYDGSSVAVEDSGPGVSLYMNLRGHKVTGSPTVTMESWDFLGFSPDSRRLLLGGDKLVVLDRALRVRLRPKSRQSPTALAGDYVTSVVLVGKGSKYRKLRLLNLRTGRTGAVVSVKLPRGQYIDDVDFDGSGRLIVRSKTATGVAIYRVSRKTGAVKLVKEFERPDATVWVLPDDSAYERWTERK